MRKSLMYLLLFPLLSVILVNCDEEEPVRPIEIETGIVINVDYESAIVTGGIIEFGKGIEAFGHCWSTNPTPSVNDEKTTVTIEVNGDFQSEITGLIDGEKYYFRSYALNEDEVVYGEIKEFSTVLYGLPIIELQIDSVQYESVNGIFKLIDFGGYDQINRIGICISTSTNPTVNDSVFTATNIDSVGIYNFQINELLDGQTYYLKAFAINNKGISYSIEKDILTLEYSLPEISINSIFNIADSSSSVEIELLNIGGQDSLLAYGLCWSVLNNPTINDYTNNYGSTKELILEERTVERLEPGTQYYVRAFAINSKGTSYSSEKLFETTNLNLGLITHYPFSGNTIDDSGNENNATNYGATLTFDRFGNENSAYKFDGSNDYMRIDHTEDLNFDSYYNSYTLSFWVKGDSAEMGISRIIEKWNELIQTPYPLSFGASSTICNGNIRNDSYFQIQFGNLWDNEWKHIVLIVNSENKFMFGYLDNLLIGSTDYSSLETTGNTSNIYFGGHPDLNNRYFKGTMDNIRFYNRALSENEIQALYHEDGWGL